MHWESTLVFLPIMSHHQLVPGYGLKHVHLVGTLVGLLQHGNVEYDVHGIALAVPLSYLDLRSVDIPPEVLQVSGDGKKK